MQDDSSPTEPSQEMLGAHARFLLRMLEPYTAEVGQRFLGLEERIAGLERRLDEVGHDIARVQSDAQGRIDEVVDNLANVAELLRGVLAAWSSPMYMTDAAGFSLPLSEGGGLGFRQDPAGPAPDAEAFYRAFEDVFRGPPEHVRLLQEEYIGILPAQGLIADIGCGRGEFLELLEAAGADRIGIDMNVDMASVAAAAGQCEVLVGDGTAWLLEQAEGSLAGIFAAQVIEHMPAHQVELFLRAAHRALNPDHGVLIAETVNPYFIPAFRMFWVDLTHECLIYPEVALTMARAVGFTTGDIHFPGGRGDLEHDRSHVGAYALVARRGTGDTPRLRLPER